MAVSKCGVWVDERERELKKHGTEGFPIACYHDDLGQNEVPWHWHDEWELIYIETGDCALSAGTEELVAHPGELCFLNAGVLHRCAYENAEDGCMLQSLVFSPTLIGAPDTVFYEKYVAPVLEGSAPRYLLFDGKRDWEAKAIRLFLDAYYACTGEPPAYELTVRASLSALFALLCQNLPEPHSALRPDIRSESRIKDMLHQIRESYGQELSIAQIAESAGISESEALRCFKRVLGTTPIRYRNAYRLAQAERLLLQTALPVGEIGERCGFPEMSYFAKVFRKAYGLSPSEYRDTHSAGLP